MTKTSRIDLVLFSMHNRAFGPYLAAINGILIPVMPRAFGPSARPLRWQRRGGDGAQKPQVPVFSDRQSPWRHWAHRNRRTFFACPSKDATPVRRMPPASPTTSCTQRQNAVCPFKDPPPSGERPDRNDNAFPSPPAAQGFCVPGQLHAQCAVYPWSRVPPATHLMCR
jgi:hypothetical protein